MESSLQRRNIQCSYPFEIQLTGAGRLKVQLHPASDRQLGKSQVVALGPGRCYYFPAIIQSEVCSQLLLAPPFAVDGAGV